MHRCLSIPEILELILNQLSIRTDRTAILHMSLTSRFSSALALARLWELQDNLGPLIQTLPQHLWKTRERDPSYRETGSFIYITKDPKPEDWQRPRFYASFIKVLVISHGYVPQSTVQISSEVYSSLGRLPLPFTRLRELCTDMEPPLDAGNAFFNPSLKHLSLYVREPFKSGDRKFLKIALAKCPNLKVINLSLPDGKREEVSSLVCGSRALERLSCNARSLNGEALVYLANLPTLKGLELEDSFPDDQNRVYPNLSFTTLPSLNIQSLTLPSFIQSSYFYQLKHIRLGWRFDVSEPEVPTCFQLLPNICPPQSLLSMDLDRYRSASNYIRSAAFRPLLVFTSLQKLSISVPSRVDDTLLSSISAAMPALRRLLIGTCEQDCGTDVTLGGLVSLVDNCSHLENLEIRIDVPLAVDIPEWKGVGNINVDMIELWGSTIVPSKEAAHFLCRLFPRLRNIFHIVRTSQADLSKNWLDFATMIRQINYPEGEGLGAESLQ